MSIKIYLIKHHDTDMGYVGITGDELGKRWYQHMHDPSSAVYKALRQDGHRMSMQILEEVETRAEALVKEQEYIHALGTAHPAGWNRQVKTPIKKQRKWIQKKSVLMYVGREQIMCPVCGCENLHLQDGVDVDNEYTYLSVACEWCHYSDDNDDNRPLFALRFWYTHGTISLHMMVWIEDKS